MRFTRATEYALRSVRYLATSNKECWHSIQEISEAEEVPLPFLAKVMQRLAQAGIALSACGKTGGYKLSRPASQINLAEVVLAIEGHLAITSCLGRSARCRFMKVCRSHKIWEELQKAILDVLNRYTIDDIVLPASARLQARTTSGCSSVAPPLSGHRAHVTPSGRSQ